VALLYRRGVGIGLLAAFLALGSYHGSSLGMARGNWFDPFVHPVVGLVVAAGIVRLLTSGRPTFLDGRVPRLFGMLSYSMYLWHYPILQFGLGWAGLRGTSDRPVLFGVVVVAILLAAIAAVTVASYVLIERPFLTRKATSKDKPAEAVPELVAA
jgi:peptidoglycan/LPS O-acetylase OafA/YrhL